MPKPVIQKVHTNIGHVRSLCGLVPKNGHYQIVPFNEFFTHPEETQCAVCLKRVEARGYSLKRMRAEALATQSMPRETH
jgi:hypothetical protein